MGLEPVSLNAVKLLEKNWHFVTQHLFLQPHQKVPDVVSAVIVLVAWHLCPAIYNSAPGALWSNICKTESQTWADNCCWVFCLFVLTMAKSPGRQTDSTLSQDNLGDNLKAALWASTTGEETLSNGKGRRFRDIIWRNVAHNEVLVDENEWLKNSCSPTVGIMDAPWYLFYFIYIIDWHSHWGSRQTTKNKSMQLTAGASNKQWNRIWLVESWNQVES